MLKLKSVTLKNFLSVGNVTQAVKLDDNGLTLVLGNNTDSHGGTSRNGAGKTSILQALSFGLYGTPLTKIKVDNLINNINQRGMLVTVDFDFDGKEYRIERGRKPNILKFFINGEEIEDMTRGENRETQLDISGIIGMSHQMFTHVVALNTYTTPFLKMRAAEQREVSEELLGVTQISSRAETLKQLVNETKERIRQEGANLKAIQEANTRIERAIETAQQQHDRWEGIHVQSVAELARQIDELNDIDFEQEKSAFDQVDAWNQHRKGLTSRMEVETVKLRSLRDDYDHVKREISRYRYPEGQASSDAALTRLETELSRKRASLSEHNLSLNGYGAKLVAKQAEIDNPGAHQCVTCDQSLDGTEHLATVIANLVKQRQKIETDIARLRTQITTTEQDCEQITQEIAELRESANKAKEDNDQRLREAEARSKPCSDAIEAQERVIDNLKDEMTSEDKPSTFFRDRDELYETKNLLDSCIAELEREKIKENPHVQHLSSLKGTLQPVDYEDFNQMEILLQHQDFLLRLLTNKDSFIRKRIIEQNLYYLNTRLSFYLEKLGLPHEVVFQNDLTVDITLLGRDYDFEQLSRGEMNRVIMSVSWSFRDVWESLNHSVNLVWVDELLDMGIDGQGAEASLAVMKSFSRNRKNVFLISHRDELVGRIDRTLMVSKVNGFTTITEDLT